ncbi:hypothetical protein [Pararhizobium polonicum]|uniref:hypothetical protein n=1 Tax=Pararhizobium polonicum TaxID=1612624 RepID=UPI0011125EE0|nr:hypothetical protein [Pararhizobium polonicum]
MKDDHAKRGRLSSTVAAILRKISRWQSERLARQAFAQIVRGRNRHLLDDIGIDRLNACYGCGPAQDEKAASERHRFWML